jgi:hypothetical protein
MRRLVLWYLSSITKNLLEEKEEEEEFLKVTI